MSKKWVVMGERYEVGYWDRNNVWVSSVTIKNGVATFDSKKSAENYIKKSKVKKIVYRRFREKSLLYDYFYAYVLPYNKKVLPHEPRIK